MLLMQLAFTNAQMKVGVASLNGHLTSGCIQPYRKPGTPSRSQSRPVWRDPLLAPPLCGRGFPAIADSGYFASFRWPMINKPRGLGNAYDDHVCDTTVAKASWTPSDARPICSLFRKSGRVCDAVQIASFHTPSPI